MHREVGVRHHSRAARRHGQTSTRMEALVHTVMYDTFISYRSTARAQARRIRSTLQSFVQPDDPAGAFSAFLDEASLLAGGLNEEIKAALLTSHSMLVLLAHDTAQSTWVNHEIEFWLANGGSPDRLFLVKLDDVDLTWDPATDSWAYPEQVPTSLHHIFKSEQKYVDLAIARRREVRVALASIFAAIRDRSIESLMLDEASRAQRRQRTTTMIATSMTGLLVLSIIAAVGAVMGRNAAEAASSEALGQAKAAQAILALESDPVAGIDYALEASSHSDSITVRAAMLAAAAPHTELHGIDFPIGYSAQDGNFSPDDEVLAIVLQSAALGNSDMLLELRDGHSAELINTIPLPAETGWVRMLSDRIGVVCSYRTGSYLLTLDRTTRSLAPIDAITDPGPAPDGMDRGALAQCEKPTALDGGLLFSTSTMGEPNPITYVRPSGSWTNVGQGTKWVAAGTQSGARVALLIGTQGAQVLEAETGKMLDVTGAHIPGNFTITAQTYGGDLFGQSGNRDWMFIRRYRGRYSAQKIRFDESIWAAAPISDSRGFTGKFVTLDHGSTLSLPDSDKKWTLGDDRSENADATRQEWRQFVPTLRQLGDSRYFAVFGSSAFVVDLKPDYPLRPGWSRAEVGDSSAAKSRTDDWAIAEIETSLGDAPRQGAAPITAVCEDSLLLDASPTNFTPAGFNDGGKLLVRADGSSRLLPDATEFTDSCAAIGTSPDLVVQSTDPTDDRVLASGVGASGRILSGSDTLAVLRGSSTAAIFNLDKDLRPWTMEAPGYQVATLANTGTATVKQDKSGFIFSGGTEPPRKTYFDGMTQVEVVSPDAAAVVASSDSEVRLVNAEGFRDVSSCALGNDPQQGRYLWLPGADYRTNARSSASPTLHWTNLLPNVSGSAQVDEQPILANCDSLSPSSNLSIATSDIRRYEVRPDGGVLETVAGGVNGQRWEATQVIWRGTSTPQVRTYASDQNLKELVWSPSGDMILVPDDPGSGQAVWTVYSWMDDQWQQGVSLTHPGTYRFTTEGLLISWSDGSTPKAQSHVWVLDPKTGHLILDAAPGAGLRAAPLTIRTVEGDIVVPLQDASRHDASLLIPIGEEKLRAQLCALHHTSQCEDQAPRPSVSGTRMTTPSASPSGAGHSAPPGWPAEMAGKWCPPSDPSNCFTISGLLEDHPDAFLASSSPSSDAVGATDFGVCLTLDQGPECSGASSMYFRYFPPGVDWDCVAVEVEGRGWPDCQPDFTAEHDSARPRLIRLLSHQHNTSYTDSEPMYRTE